MSLTISRAYLPDMEFWSQSPPTVFSRAFATEHGFVHCTSSPHFPQDIGAAERGVKLLKLYCKKSNDLYEALLAYRSTPLKNGYSPAELLTGRQLQITVPNKLTPCLPDKVLLKRRKR